MTRLRAVTLDELPSAPIQIRVDRTIAAPRRQVFDLLVGDPARWGDLLPGLGHEGHWVEQTSDGIGNVRSLGRGRARLTETILANDGGSHWAFRVETAPFPLAKALIEDYKLEDYKLEDYKLGDSAEGCTLHWTGAVWPVGPAAVMRPILSASLTLIITRLSHGLQATASQTR